MEASDNAPERSLPKTIDYILTDGGQEVHVNVYARRIKQYLENGTPKWIPFIDESGIDFIAAQIRELIRDKFDCIVMISGARRKGKSTLGIQIARKVSPSFVPEQIAFRLEDFTTILDKNPYADPESGTYPQAFLDEAGVGLYSKEWYASWQRSLVKCLEVIGIKRQVCYFILPHARKLTGDIRDEMASLWIDVDTKYKHERGYAELFTGVRDKFRQSIWWRPKFAFKFNPLMDDFWKQYESRKVAFVNEMASGKVQGQQADPLARRIAQEIEKGKSVDIIATEFGMHRATIYRYIQKLRIASGEPASNIHS